MNEYKFVYEGRITKDQRYLEPGSCYWDEDRFPLPVLHYPNNDNYSLGRAWATITHLERRGGIIYATTDRELPEGFVLSASGDGDITYKYTDEELSVVFTKYRIIGAVLLAAESWAWEVGASETSV